MLTVHRWSSADVFDDSLPSIDPWWKDSIDYLVYGIAQVKSNGLMAMLGQWTLLSMSRCTLRGEQAGDRTQLDKLEKEGVPVIRYRRIQVSDCMYLGKLSSRCLYCVEKLPYLH